MTHIEQPGEVLKLFRRVKADMSQAAFGEIKAGWGLARQRRLEDGKLLFTQTDLDRLVAAGCLTRSEIWYRRFEVAMAGGYWPEQPLVEIGGEGGEGKGDVIINAKQFEKGKTIIIRFQEWIKQKWEERHWHWA